MQPDHQSVNATAWTDYPYELEGDEVSARAELCDVDEVALIVVDQDGAEMCIVHLDRVHAIALAGQLAAAASTSQVTLPQGHGPEGPLA